MEDQSLRWLSVDGKSSAQLADTLSHACLDLGQVSLSGNGIDDFDNELADLPKLGGAKSACGSSGRAQPYAGGDRRLLGIKGDRVLVRGDVGAIERTFR